MKQYCGGTWQGIIDKVSFLSPSRQAGGALTSKTQLDYIQGMGFTAIWITPVTKQLPQDTAYGEAYHGYWQQDA